MQAPIQLFVFAELQLGVERADRVERGAPVHAALDRVDVRARTLIRVLAAADAEA